MSPLPFSRWLVGVSALMALPAAVASERVQVVTSFSILADMVEQVGGEHVEVTSLVGPDGDAHVYSPSPGDARALADADLVVFNGLLYEGWMERLVDSSDYAGALVTATQGIEPLARAGQDDHDEHGHNDHGHDEHGHDGHGHDAHSDEAEHAHGDDDPHAWQDLARAETYVENIRDGLIEADGDNRAAYEENAERYLAEIQKADAEIRALIEEIPPSTSVITGHDSFGYFADAYGVRFLSPVGLSTEADPSGASMAELIDVIEEENVEALFHENMTNQSILDQLAEETGLSVAGTLYADALSSDGEASTYLGMMRHNAKVLHDALADPDHEDHGQADEHDHAHEDDHGHDHDHGDHDH